ncbi:MAG: hypothetical protein Kow0010_17170 [Dehalococcoidia bacterium]
MTTFWHWCVRNPALLIAAVSLAAAAASVIEWPLGLAGIALFGVIAKLANHLGRLARRRQHRPVGVSVDEFEEPADAALKQRLRELDDGLERAA